MPGAPLHSVPTGTDASGAGVSDSSLGADVDIAADSLDIDLEPALAAVGTTAVVAASLIDFLR